MEVEKVKRKGLVEEIDNILFSIKKKAHLKKWAFFYFELLEFELGETIIRRLNGKIQNQKGFQDFFVHNQKQYVFLVLQRDQ